MGRFFKQKKLPKTERFKISNFILRDEAQTGCPSIDLSNVLFWAELNRIYAINAKLSSKIEFKLFNGSLSSATNWKMGSP